MQPAELFEIGDAVFSILLNADDRTLGRLCQENQSTNAICQSELFWRRRSEQYLGHLLPLKEFFPSWRDLYLTARKPGFYAVVGGSNDVRLFSTIQEAYDYLVSRVVPEPAISGGIRPPINEAEQLRTIPSRSILSIYLIFDQEEFTGYWDLSRLLLRVASSPEHFLMRPGFQQLPDLQSRGTFIYYFLVDLINEEATDNRMGVSHPTSDLFERLEHQNERFADGHLFLLTVDLYSQYFIDYDDQRFFRREIPALIIDRVDDKFMMARLPDQYYHDIDIDIFEPPFSVAEIPPTEDLILHWEPVENITQYPPDATHLLEVEPEKVLSMLKFPSSLPMDEVRRMIMILQNYSIDVSEYLGHYGIADRYLFNGVVSFSVVAQLFQNDILVSQRIIPTFQDEDDNSRHNVIWTGLDATGKMYLTIVQYDPATDMIFEPIRM